jgi:hypothetical protein
MLGAGLMAITAVVGVATWQDAGNGSRTATFSRPVEAVPQRSAADISTRETTIGGMAELYGEQQALAALNAGTETMGGLGELYRERQAERTAAYGSGVEARGGLAELYAEQALARRAAVGGAIGD